MKSAPDSAVCCPHSTCGGCALIALPYAEQLERKRARLAGALSRHPSLAAWPAPAVRPAEPIIGYRTRAKLVVGAQGELGLYASGSHDVVDIPRCQVISPALLGVAAALRPLLGELVGLSAVDLRAAGDGAEVEVIVTLIGRLHRERCRATLARVAEIPGVATVALAERSPDSPQVLGKAPVVVHGPTALPDRASAASPYALVTAGSFAQAHRAQQRALHAALLGMLGAPAHSLAGRRVLELFAGSGQLSLELCRHGAEVTMVERFAPAAALARRAASEQGLPLEVLEEDAARALASLGGARFDVALVNPPRRGLSPEVRAGLARLGAASLVYVSCEPQTLARDLAALRQLGYAPVAIEAFDMIPLSAEVECLVSLAPAAPVAIDIVYEDAELVVAQKPPHLPTVPASGGSCLLERLREQLSEPSLTAVHRLDAGTSGLCLFARHPRAVAAWSRALADGHKTYLGLARGVARARGRIARPIREQGRALAATTRYRRKAVLGGHSLLELAPEQGRRHQLRRHLAALGHPVLGDERYGHAASNAHLLHRHGLDRTFLHLWKIALTHPHSGSALEWRAELAPDLSAVSDSLARATQAQSSRPSPGSSRSSSSR